MNVGGHGMPCPYEPEVHHSPDHHHLFGLGLLWFSVGFSGGILRFT